MPEGNYIEAIGQTYDGSARTAPSAFIEEIEDAPVAEPVAELPSEHNSNQTALIDALIGLANPAHPPFDDIEDIPATTHTTEISSESRRGPDLTLDLSSNLQPVGKPNISDPWAQSSSYIASSSKVPLFLPSPSNSSQLGGGDGVFDDSAVASSTWPENRAYVLVPPLPDWAKRVKAGQRAKKGEAIGALQREPTIIHDEPDDG